MNRKWLTLGLISVVIAIPLWAKVSNSRSAIEVEIEPAARREIKASILASGNLVYEEQAQLSPEVLGRVESILVKEGDHVAPGQVVLKLDEKVYRAEVQQQQAAVQQQRIAIEQQALNIANQERLYLRQKELYDSNFISHGQFDDARFALDAARIEVRARQESLLQAQAVLAQTSEGLAKTDIRAPMAGTVISVDIKVGETAVPSSVGIAGSNLMTVANTKTVITDVNVDEADIAKVKVGQDVSIHLGAYPDLALSGKVQTLPLASNRNDERMMQQGGGNASLSRSYSIKASVQSPPGLLLKPGMTCRAEIFTSSATHSIAMPIQAVLSDSDDQETASGRAAPRVETARPIHYVMIDNGGVSAKRVVVTGLSDDSYQEITSGLQPGDRVIVGPYKLLRHMKAGERLQAVQAASASSGAK